MHFRRPTNDQTSRSARYGTDGRASSPSYSQCGSLPHGESCTGISNCRDGSLLNFPSWKGKSTSSVLSISHWLCSLCSPLYSEIHLSLFEHLIYEYWDWKSIEKELEEEELGISRQRRRRSSKRWVNNQGSMRSLREVSLPVSLETMVWLDHSTYQSLLFANLAIVSRRHQEIDRLSVVRWIEESASRRYAIARRYQRPHAWRSRNC